MTLRQQGFRAVLLATGAVVATLVVGCGGGQSASGNTSPAPQPASANSPTSSGQAGAISGQDVATKTGGSLTAQCRTSDLSATLGTKTELTVDVQGQLGAAGTHYSIPLIWTNHSRDTCTMTGFGGVDIDGPNLGSTAGPTYSLPRNADTPAKVTLAPGGSAHTLIYYIDPSDSPNGPQWTPTHLSVTPPNETTQLTVPWTAGTAVYQDPEDGAVAASISPVTSGA
ncbi:MAG TPA: DUF4232 domain-containing protein [Pseudonocardiaceae bacterium]|jgi:hypothetical protein|nr:DUF4232 domain-containing protein [Pseudonocardiaceae bacterium]